MADTRAAAGLTVEQWDDEFFTEDFQTGDFSSLYGTDENSVIQVKEDLTKKKGDGISFALINRLTNDATEGSNTLEGNEEELISRSHKLTVDKRRHGVLISEMEEQKSAIGLRQAAKPALKNWATEDTRDRIITELGSINRVPFLSADETARDAWLVDNADRVLFGAAVSNNAANDHSAAMAQIDSTNDILKRNTVSLMARLTRTASPKIRPVRDPGNGKRVFIMYAHPYVFRDLENDMEGVLDDTTAAGKAMQLYEGGDLMWRGVIIKQLDDLPVYTTAQTGGSVAISPVYLLGAQAIGYGIARRWKTFEKRFDYDDKAGCAVDAIDGFEKLLFGTGSSDTADLKQHGVVTGFMAAVAD
jgi:N4-gp56 family major capsid protein